MTVRQFNGISYPIPGIDTAIQVLRPGARWGMENDKFCDWEDEEGREPPTDAEIQPELAREIEIFRYFEYERKRSEGYPLLEDQLDLLYHDIKNGNLDNGSWIKSIDEVKEKFPKPKEPQPDLTLYINYTSAIPTRDV